jgi:uncharacterized membrane protein (UPF0127 family)
MQKADNEKTGSGHKVGGSGRHTGRNVLFTGVTLACLAGVAVWLLARNLQAASVTDARSSDSDASQDSEISEPTPASFTYKTVPMVVGDRTFTLDVADTEAKKRLGLGDRDGLAIDKGMVFLYSREGELCFWMKDMRFPIDIIWLDHDKRVVHIEPSLSPDTYPQTYCPSKAQYVVELAAGETQAAGIQKGSVLDVEL